MDKLFPVIPGSTRNLYKYLYRFQLKAGMTRIVFFGFIISLILYWQILPFAFTQDDFFLLRQARFNSFLEQLTVSLPRSDTIYFRPIGMQGYFFLAWRLFGLHPWAYRLVALFVHALNATFVYLIAKKILPKNSWVVWLLYLTAPLHFAAIGWIANISFVLVTCFVFLALLSIFLFRSSWIVSFLLSIAALLTNELAISLPILIFVLSFNEKKSHRRQVWEKTIPIVVITAAYLIFRLSMPRASSGDYGIELGSRTIQNIRWLLLWTMGWTESIRDYFINIWRIKDEFIHTFPFETLVQVFTTLLLSIILLLGINERKFWIGIFFFLTATLPVLLFRQHIYPHYAMIGSMGLFFAIVVGLNKLPKLFLFVVIIFWILQTISVMRVNMITHWWIQHALLSQRLQREVKTQYPVLPFSKQISVVFSQPDQARIVFAEDNAVEVLYNDPHAKAVYLPAQ